MLDSILRSYTYNLCVAIFSSPNQVSSEVLSVKTPSPANLQNLFNMSVASVCKLGTCPLEYGMVHYQPTLFGSVFYLVIFAALLIIYVIQLRHWNAWSFSYCMLSGLALELVGYLGRIQMHCDPFAPNPFLAYVFQFSSAGVSC